MLVPFIAACEGESKGFNLPKGSAEQGKANFVLLQCNDCHSIEGVITANESEEHRVNVWLGGKTTKVKTYGDLVTSIINPSHKISRAIDKECEADPECTEVMRNYNEVMTVQELIDIVAFLQSKYEIWVPQSYKYGY